MQINNISDREAMFFLSSLAELGYASKRAIYENIKPLYSIFEMNFENLKIKVKLSFELVCVGRNVFQPLLLVLAKLKGTSR